MDNKAKVRVKLRMLLVDDDDIFRNRLRRALSDRGLEVATAADGEEAVVVASEFRPDRAVVDLRMPGESGLETVRRLLRQRPDMEVVVLTGYGSIPSATEAIRLGAVEYLTKPADSDQILAAFDGDVEAEAEVTVPEKAPSLARVEWEHIQRVLSDCRGNVSQAARVLGIHRRSLQRKLAKYPPID